MSDNEINNKIKELDEKIDISKRRIKNRYNYIAGLVVVIIIDIILFGLELFCIFSQASPNFVYIIIILLSLIVSLTIPFFVVNIVQGFLADKRLKEFIRLKEELLNPKPNNENTKENIEMILEYKKLYDQNIITKEEFEKKKEELLK